MTGDDLYQLLNLVGPFLGFLFTVGVFSYILGDNFLFRIAIYIFVGVAAGFSVIVVWYQVIWPQLVYPVLSGQGSEWWLDVVLLVLSSLLLTKISPRLSSLGNPVMAFLVGVGAATAVGGAVLGTVIPQVEATIRQFDFSAEGPAPGQAGLGQFLNAVIILIGVISTLTYFHFGGRSGQHQPVRRPAWIEAIAKTGQVLIAITFGALFAGVYAASISALVERIQAILQLLMSLLLLSG